ncbi:MAG: hypothetical protein ACK5PF_05770 [bacterium]|jgi:hypothetical protein
MSLNLLIVSPQDPTWQRVEAFVMRRVEELKEEAINLNLPPEFRSAAAAKVAELRVLLRAPAEAAAIVAGSSQNSGETY